MIYTFTTYVRLFLVNTLDMLFFTYNFCYDNCFSFDKFKTTKTTTTTTTTTTNKRKNSNYLELGLIYSTNQTPINITTQPLVSINDIKKETNNIDDNNKIDDNNNIKNDIFNDTKLEIKEENKFSPEIIEFDNKIENVDWDIL